MQAGSKRYLNGLEMASCEDVLQRRQRRTCLVYPGVGVADARFPSEPFCGRLHYPRPFPSLLPPSRIMTRALLSCYWLRGLLAVLPSLLFSYITQELARLLFLLRIHLACELSKELFILEATHAAIAPQSTILF